MTARTYTNRTHTKSNVCLTPNFLIPFSASHILKLRPSALKAPVSLIQRPLHEAYDMAPTTYLVDSTANSNNTGKEEVGKKLKTAHAGLEQGKLR